ncbi:hypothetical protein SUGI_0133440 [Cryptomeria japonica]|uniref:probable xyloglucan 6-xylosyltransferase 1 n=1 Tax=Cryptomeria japonica TaxID=3369 RepID=UPI002408B004|nr:probable xyloglucan 6-xylosyltransferase 1 [Cryptomeria japonica]GLJ10702.1 hypothetical protein SUGI_0133440 [Cryptomeria japonica]
MRVSWNGRSSFLLFLWAELVKADRTISSCDGSTTVFYPFQGLLDMTWLGIHFVACPLGLNSYRVEAEDYNGNMETFWPMSRTTAKMVTWVSVKSFVMGSLVTAIIFLSLGNLGNMEANVDPNRGRLLNRFMQTATTSPTEFVKNADYGDVLNGPKAVTRVVNQVDQATDKVFGSVPPFILVTGERSSPCISPRGNNVMMKSYKNKVDYCNLHGCKVWYALEVWQKGFVGTWVRYPLLIQLMKANPSVTWFMWMDSDAVLTDFNFSIPFETYNTWNKNLVVPGFWDKVYGEDPDWIGLNAGIFLIRNCEWSHKFLEKWMEFGAPENLMASKEALNRVVKSRPKEWDPDDQSALVYLLNQNKTKSEDNVFLEASYVLHGYFEYIIDRFGDFLEGKEKQPFITHFNGCNFCGKKNITERCSEGFERAFNFADNQLLSSVGRKHSSLSTLLESISPT